MTSSLIFASIPVLAEVQINNSYICDPCKAGTYSDGTGCKTCPKGTYSQNASGECKKCQKGFYQDKEGSSECKICESGTYSKEGYANCQSCNESEHVSYNGECGSVTETRKKYCYARGSTSATDFPYTYTQQVDIGGCSGNRTCSNGKCVACSLPSGAKFTSSSGCGWTCKSNYKKTSTGCIALGACYCSCSAGGCWEGECGSSTSRDDKYNVPASECVSHSGSNYSCSCSWSEYSHS